jgi:hypothetical protein
MRYLRFGLAALAFIWLGGCASSIEPSRYAGEKPALDLQKYFNGTVDAVGIVQDRSGAVIKRFTVVMKCRWEGDVGTLDEDFTYSDGTKQRRVWTVRKTGPGRYIGAADDVIGEAAGETAGNAMLWKYVLALPVKGTTYHINFEDWMYLMNDDVMINRAAMSKFGIHLGEIVLSFQKRK